MSRRGLRSLGAAAMAILSLVPSLISGVPSPGAERDGVPGPRGGRAGAIGESPRSSWTVEDILTAESASEWEVSPDGRRLVWVRSRMDKEKNGRIAHLVLTDLSTRREVPLTRGTDLNTRPRWSPSGALLAFLSTRPLPKPNPEAAKSQLWLIDPSGGEPWPLTESVREVREFAWAGDGAIVFSAPEDPSLYEQERKKLKDTTRVVDDVAHEPPVRLFRVSVKDGKVERLTANTDFITVWGLTPDGHTALAVHHTDPSFEWDHRVLPKVFLHDLGTGSAKEILSGRRIIPAVVRAAQDGSGFYIAAPFSSDPRFFTATVTRLHFHDLASGRTVEVDLDWPAGLGSALGPAAALETTPDGFVALLAAGVRYRPARYVKSGDAWRRTDLAGDHAANMFGLSLSRDGKVAVYDHSTASTPHQLVRAFLENGRFIDPVIVTDLNPSFKTKAAARTEIVRWTGALGEEVEGLLFYPLGYESGRRYPLFTAPHGGPAGADLDAWDESWAYAAQLVCQRGAFVLKPNYHGSSNYGLAFVESICCGKYYEYPVFDIEAGVDALIARGLVDPDRIGTFGWSNGSILSIALAVANPDRYKVVAAGAGDVEFISDWANVDFGHSFDTYYLGKSPLEDPELYVRISPLFQMDKVRAPTIIFFGTEDRNVPTSQGWTHYRALSHLGRVPVRFLLFPGEPHSLQEYAHQQRKLEEEMAWFDRWFFKTEKAENPALKKGSPLGRALSLGSVARMGRLYGLKGPRGTLIPETVVRGGLAVGRFEVTRAQFAAFDPKARFAEGTGNFPATAVTFDRARAYVAWLSKLTGETWRLPTEEEWGRLQEGVESENTLDHWAGYAVNPDDAARLAALIKELGGPSALLLEVGSFPGAGKDGEALLFDLGGNAAEWVVTATGQGKPAGRSADRPSDSKAGPSAPDPSCVGFRVVKGEGAKTR